MKKRKRPMTLMEIMVVIMIIGIVGSIIGVNMRGSLERTKIFKTKEAIKKVRDILMLEWSLSSKPMKYIVDNRESVLKNSGLAPDVNDFLKDGWGDELIVEMEKDEILVTSKHQKKLNAH